MVALPSTGYLVAGDYMGQKESRDVFVASLDGAARRLERRYGGAGVAAGGVYDSDPTGLTLTMDGGCCSPATPTRWRPRACSRQATREDGSDHLRARERRRECGLGARAGELRGDERCAVKGYQRRARRGAGHHGSSEAVTGPGHAETP